MNGAVVEPVLIISPEERTGFGTFREDIMVIVEMTQLRRDSDHMLLPGILVLNLECVLINGFYDVKDLAQVTTAFATLLTLK